MQKKIEDMNVEELYLLAARELEIERADLDTRSAEFRDWLGQYVNAAREVPEIYDDLEWELYSNKHMKFEGTTGNQTPVLTAEGVDLITTHTHLTHADMMTETGARWDGIRGKLTKPDIARLMTTFAKRAGIDPPIELPLEVEQVNFKRHNAPLIRELRDIFDLDESGAIEGKAIQWSINAVIKDRERSGMDPEAAEVSVYEDLRTEDIWGTLSGLLCPSALRQLTEKCRKA